MKKLQPHKIREVIQHVGITEKDEGRKLTSVSTFWATCSRCSNLLKKIFDFQTSRNAFRNKPS